MLHRNYNNRNCSFKIISEPQIYLNELYSIFSNGILKSKFLKVTRF